MQQPQHGRGAQQADEQQHHTGNGADNGRRVDGLFHIAGMACAVEPGHQYVDAVAQADEKPVNRVTKMLVEPTEPRAVEPAKRPTTATSDMLKRTCSRLDRTSGRLTRRICLARGPRSVTLWMNSCFFPFSYPEAMPAHTGAQALL